jgi:hypothetical protein
VLTRWSPARAFGSDTDYSRLCGGFASACAS